jgi:hypothetical protein
MTINDRAKMIDLMKVVEKDPNGRSPHDKGSKLDDGKVKAGLVLGGFAPALLEVSKVGTFGALKYTPDGWKEVPGGLGRYNDAKVRHMLLEASGEMYDNDSGLLHAAHEAWNALAKLHFLLLEVDSHDDHIGIG